MLAEHFVLGGQDALDGAHERAALTGQVGVDLTLEVGLEEVAGTDGDTEGQGALERTAGGVLVDGERRIDATALQEQTAHGGAGALRGHHDHVDVLRRDDAGAVVEGDAEAVGEVERLAGGQVLLDHGPLRDLGGVGKEVFDHGRLLAGLLDAEEGLAGHPAVRDSLVVGLAGALANDDVDAVVLEVQGLSGALDAIADHGDNLVLKDFTGFFNRKLIAGDDVLDHSAEIHLCHTLLVFIGFCFVNILP